MDALALPAAETWRGPEPDGPAPDRPAFRIPVRRSLRMHWKLAGLVALAVLLALLGYALTRKPIYEAESRVYVEPIQTRMLSDTAGSFDGGRYESFLREQMETVERPDILLAAVRSLPIGVWQQPGETAEAAAGRLAAAVKAERVSTSYQLAISVRAETPRAAAAAANAVTEAYLAAGVKDALALSAGRLEVLTAGRTLRATGPALRRRCRCRAGGRSSRPRSQQHAHRGDPTQNGAAGANARHEDGQPDLSG